jgi:hypothetical protein
MIVPISMLLDSAWFRMDWSGDRGLPAQQMMVGQRVVGYQHGDVRVRLTNRWGRPVREELWISSRSMVTPIAEPVPEEPLPAAVPVEPELEIAPQEERIFDPFED